MSVYRVTLDLLRDRDGTEQARRLRVYLRGASPADVRRQLPSTPIVDPGDGVVFVEWTCVRVRKVR